MKKRCTPQIVMKAHKRTRSWRKTARELNQLYGVNLSHASWSDFAQGRHDIADTETRTRLGLGPRACPGCGRKHITRKQTRRKRIRQYGYPTVEARSFIEALKLREAMR
jgi:hypothetical protein